MTIESLATAPPPLPHPVTAKRAIRRLNEQLPWLTAYEKAVIVGLIEAVEGVKEEEQNNATQ